MRSKKECVAMLLAGGQGSRLYALTSDNAKPAVTYGAKYRIIDFPLSNCVNSKINTVGVLTQYEPLLLNDYIGNGQPWDLDRNFGGVHILPPYQARTNRGWYKGTANAIYQNINFIKRYNPEYVLVLSGDHIYKMDYHKMLAYHKEKQADCTIAVIDVDIKEASRFGIMASDDENRIYEFEEKPKKPKSTLASMGIYIFNTEVLFNYLIKDEQDPNSSNDFGKNIIPKMIADEMKLYSYQFQGYWKDVGTVSSLWESNMDLLGEKPVFDIFDKQWKIYSRNHSHPPHIVGEKSCITNSIITEGCVIDGEVINSVISNNVRIEVGARVINSVIFENTIVEKNAKISFSILDENVKVAAGIEIGGTEQITVVGHDLYVDKNITEGLIVEKE